MARNERRLSIWFTLWLLLAVTVVNLWIRSYLVADRFRVAVDTRLVGGAVEIFSSRGSLGLSLEFRFDQEDRRTSLFRFFHSSGLPHEPSGARTKWTAAGWLRFVCVPNANGIVLRVPHWFILLLSVLMFTRGFRRNRLLRHRRRRGLCLTCGYDLRGSTERCPECGTMIPAEMQQTQEAPK